ncbi:MAG: DegV family protein [Anaerolineae bacterium]|jgi:DegV family protein with EDD domain|nr:DegV family protein [Anaerolineae bacterium]
MVNIVTDSTADLGPELVERHHIHVVPLWVHLGEHSLKDDFAVTPERLFEFAETSNELPKTAAPSVAEFMQVFGLPGETVYIGISSRLSASVMNGRNAAQTFEEGKVRVVDSLNLSTGLGLLALKAADLRDQGKNAKEIERALTEAIPKVQMSFALDTLKYLYMGGRCTALQSLVGGVLKIRPVISARPDGTLGVKDKVRGTRKRALESMLVDFQEHLPEVDLQRVFVTHSGCADDAAFLCGELAKLAPIEEILITRAGAVISSHCGPGTIGILYMLK